MRLNVYSIFDRASGVYDRPWCAHSDKAAVRSFTDVAQDESHPIGKHPEDFTLFRVGTWVDDEGAINGEVPTKVINAAEAYSKVREITPGSLKEVNYGGSE